MPISHACWPASREGGVASASTADAAPDPAHDEHDQPDQHDRPADVAQRLAARAAGQVDRERVQRQHEHQQQRAEHAHDLHGGLRGRELIGAHHGDHARVRRDPGQRRSGQPQVGPELL